MKPSLFAFLQRRRKFLLTVGGALALFLGLESCVVSSIRDGARSDTRRALELRSSVIERHAQLRRRYWEEIERTEALRRSEDALRKELCLPQPEIDERSDPGTLLVQLDEAIDRAWSKAEEVARPRGLRLPEKLRAREDLDVRPGDGPREHANYQAYVRVVGLALRRLAEAGMSRIEKPILLEPEILEVPESTGFRGISRSAQFTVRGPYRAFLKLCELCQEAGAFLQVEITDLRPSGEDAAELEGGVRFAGLELAEGPIEGGEAAPIPAGSGRRPR